MIEVKNLCKSFGEKEVLKDISTVFDSGKTNLIIGQSGSGKTVLVKNLVGLLDLQAATCSTTDATSWPWTRRRR